jgi:spore coat polysaccharide biosynthesis protein SpsF
MGGDVWNRPRPLLFNRRSLRVLVAMGGSDPNGLTARTVRAIMAAGKDLQPVIVIGPSVADPQSVVNECHAAAPDAEMVLAPSSVMDVAADCDLAILAYGVTAFECAHVGTPAIYLGLTADHAQSAESCARAGFGINLGVIAGLKDTRITAAVSDLAADAERRRLMSAAGRQTIDGRAAERLAADIAQRIHENALLMQQVLEAAG